MLSITKLTPNQGEHYYQKENYYTKGDALKHSEWFGLGATALGLSGEVQDQDFANLLYSRSPDGSQELSGKKVNPQTHRAGVDLTFSAPKSLSIAALVGGEPRLIAAHRRAVLRALEVAEQRFAQTRVSVDGIRQTVYTGNLAIAQFHHDTSRLKDPQLHTHCIVLNMTQLENGQWRSQNYGLMYSNKMFLGQLYRNELACQVQKLGYEIEHLENGLFEIKGYTQEQLEAFSKRSQQIKTLVDEGADSKQKERAALKDRPRKANEIPFYQQKYQWELEAEALGIEHPKVLHTNEATSIQDAAKAVSAGIEHCHKRDIAFKREQVEQFVMSEVGRCDWLQLQSAFDNNTQLLRTTNGRYTTQSALDREHDTIQLVWQGQGAVDALAHPWAVHQHLEKTFLNHRQRAAVMMAATTKDQFTAWVGVAEQSQPLRELMAIAQAMGYKFKGFTANTQAASVLGDRRELGERGEPGKLGEQTPWINPGASDHVAGVALTLSPPASPAPPALFGSDVAIEAQTVASLLVSKQLERPEPNQFWAVNEAGLLSAKEVIALLQRATDQQARVLLVCDPRQVSAADSGNPLKSLLSADLQFAYLNKSRRLETEDLKEVVDLVADDKIHEAIERLHQGHLEIIPSRDQRADKIKDDFMALSPTLRKQTSILAGSEHERLAITECIRLALKTEGTLGTLAKLTQLKFKDLTSVQSQFTNHFQSGDVVIPLRHYQQLNLTKGELYTVTDKDKNTLTLHSGDGSTKTVDPAKFKKAVYQRQEIEIAEGDRLCWTKNNHQLRRTNGQRFTIRKIELNTNSATIRYDSGKTERIDLRQAQHLEHALVSPYHSPARIANRVIVSTSNEPPFIQSDFLAQFRAKSGLKIYAYSSECLFKRAQSNHAHKNPLHVVLEQQKQAKSALKNSLAELRNSAITREDSLKIKPKTISAQKVLENQQSQGLHL